MKLSIIIPVRNEEILVTKIIDQLESKLKSLSYEIVFINDFSADNTLKIATELVKNKPEVNIYNNERKGLGGAISKGIDLSSNSIIFKINSKI